MGIRGRLGIATILVLVVGLALGASGAAAKKGAKMRVTQLDPPPSALDAGESFRVEGKVRNSGKASSRANVRVLLRGPEEGLAGTVTTGKVKPKKTREFSLTATVPGLPSGTYRLVACVPKTGTSGKERCLTAKGTVTVTGATNFTPGARSAGDPLFPQTGNGGYDVGHYDIQLDYDVQNNVFSTAATAIDATATQNLSEFTLDFQDQLEVSEVTVNGQPATFSFAPTAVLGDPSFVTQLTKLVVTPAVGIPSGTDFDVVITYSGEPQLMTDVDESWEGWIPACHGAGGTPPCDGAFVVNQPNGAQTWFPNNNYPTDKATFDTTITVADSHVAFGIGELESRTDNGDTATWSWGEDDPTSTYLTTATVGLFDYETNVVFEDSTSRALPYYGGIDSSYPAQTKLNVSTTQSLTSDMLNFLSDTYEPYPLDSIGSIVDRAQGVGYALEVQTKPAYAHVGNASQDISDFTQLHEIAHMWFGNTVTLEQWPDIWFNEGFATWSEWIWDFEENAGTTSPAEMFDALYEEPTFDWALPPATLNGDPTNLFDAATYDRGAMVVQGTYEILGEDGFNEFVDTLFDRFAYDNISTQEYIATAEEVSGFEGAQLELLGDFYEQWLYGTEQPTILPEDVTGAPRRAAAGVAAASFPGDGR